eukprot:scaffold8774_cov158-Isochrysis_galbana.AAC.5
MGRREGPHVIFRFVNNDDVVPFGGMRWLVDSYSRCGAGSAPRHNHTPTSGSGSATASHRTPGRQRPAACGPRGRWRARPYGPSPMPRSDRARWCRRA